MKIDNKKYNSIWYDKKKDAIFIIDQTALPFKFKINKLNKFNDFIRAIKNMEVRGAPLIGVTAAYGMYFASKKSSNVKKLEYYGGLLIKTRPTAINLKWSVEKILSFLYASNLPQEDLSKVILEMANKIKDEDIRNCYQIGLNGSKIINKIYIKKNKKIVNILTHCNAGWLATVDWGTALAPIYYAKLKNKNKIHVWVDETRPRNQGANLTSFELNNQGVANTIIADNTGGLLMMKKKVDLCIVGADRITKDGSVINKIGTYLKALAAYENNIPFYVAIPYSTIDAKSNLPNDIEIEDRGGDELRYILGIDNKGNLKKVRIYSSNCKILNLGFDITPPKLITGYITEKGIFQNIKEFLIKN